MTETIKMRLFSSGILIVGIVLFCRIMLREANPFIEKTEIKLTSIGYDSSLLGLEMLEGENSENIKVYNNKFDISYPAQMNIDETQIIILKFSGYINAISIDSLSQLNSNILKGSLPQKKIDFSILYKDKGPLLTSSGFDIAPSNKIISSRVDIMPLEYTWTITPRKEGNHKALLDITDLCPEGLLSLNTELFVNQQKTAYGYGEKLKVFPIVIKVNNIWGFSEKISQLVIMVFSLVGFILMCPVLLDNIKRMYDNKVKS